MAAVATVDSRGRVKLPRGTVRPGDKVLVINAGSRLILIPIPPRPLEASSSWLKRSVSRSDVRRIAEEEALREVEEKIRRRLELVNRD